jgi:AcrR family transcriptional regulator
VAASREMILQGTIRTYKKYGPRFNTDDLCRETGITKRDVFAFFPNKESILLGAIDMYFSYIGEAKDKMVQMDIKNKLDTPNHFINVLSAMPEGAESIDFTQLFSLKNEYPRVYARIRMYLETNWDNTFKVLDKGIDEGVFRPVNKIIFQIAYQAAIERFLSSDELKQNNISYMDALRALATLLVDGITVKKEEETIND